MAKKSAPSQSPAPEPKGPAPLAARRTAAAILLRVHGGARATPLLHAHFVRQNLAARERAWLTELVLGTLRHEAALVAQLQTLLPQPLHKLPPQIVVALKIGAYEIMHMATPAYGAVNSAVSLVPSRFGRLVGLANAVLRKLADAAPTAHAPNESTDVVPSAPCANDTGAPSAPRMDATKLAVLLSQPVWFVEAMQLQLGHVQAEQALRANNDRPPIHLRVNTLRTKRDALVERLTAHGVAATVMADVPNAICLARAGAITDVPGFAEGHFSVQDGAAQLVTQLLAAKAGATVVDLCAAPGGKTGHILEQMGDQGRVLAIDRHAGKLLRLQQNLDRLGHQSVTCLQLDAADAKALQQAIAQRHFPAPTHILLDAPCSAMGTIRRHPELRRVAKPPSDALLGLQRQLLHAAAAQLAVGGILVYAVCSPLPAETTAQTDDFLAAHPQFSVQPPQASLAAFVENNAVRCWPHRHGLDGFYAIRFRRNA